MRSSLIMWQKVYILQTPGGYHLLKIEWTGFVKQKDTFIFLKLVILKGFYDKSHPFCAVLLHPSVGLPSLSPPPLHHPIISMR